MLIFGIFYTFTLKYIERYLFPYDNSRNVCREYILSLIILNDLYDTIKDKYKVFTLNYNKHLLPKSKLLGLLFSTLYILKIKTLKDFEMACKDF